MEGIAPQALEMKVPVAPVTQATEVELVLRQ